MSNLAKTSRIPGFYKLPIEERVKIVKEFANLTDEEVKALLNSGSMPLEIADKMIENVIGVFHLPFAVATNFLINGKDYLVPMVIEEPSVVAAACNAAKMVRAGGGFKAKATDPIMIGQIQLTKVKDPEEAKKIILSEKEKILEIANEQDPILVKLGGGAKDLEVRIIDTIKGPMVIIHLLVDVRDAMGANAVNTMAEAVAPYIEKITGGKVYLRIISNLAVKRLVRVECTVPKEVLGGEEVVDAILYAYAFALADPYRAVTHNKGIMNGIDAVVIATGNDFRAVEAGAHSYAARNGKYRSLTKYYKNEDGDLVGEIELPVAVGTVGGATRTHPIAKIALKILGVKTAKELGLKAIKVGREYLKRVPLGRFGEADEVARMVLVLASDLSSYVQGALLVTDGKLFSA